MSSPAIERLAKWRVLLTGWQLGTRAKGDPESDAVRDHREATLLQRVELSALTALLIERGVISADDFTRQLDVEAEHLNRLLEQRFPGVTATAEGLTFDQRVLAWMKGWLP